MIDLEQLQAEVKAWNEHNFGELSTPNKVILALGKVMEELGDLAHHVVCEVDGVRIGENHEEGAKDAVGDIVIALTAFCIRTGMSLDAEVLSAWNRVNIRDWKKYPHNGVTH